MSRNRMTRASRRNMKVKDVIFTEVQLLNTATVRVTLSRSIRNGESKCSTIAVNLEACTARELVVQLKKAFVDRQRITTNDIAIINGSET